MAERGGVARRGAGAVRVEAAPVEDEGTGAARDDAFVSTDAEVEEFFFGVGGGGGETAAAPPHRRDVCATGETAERSVCAVEVARTRNRRAITAGRRVGAWARRVARDRTLLRRVGLGAALVAIGVATVVFVSAVSLMRQRPAWWRAFDIGDPATAGLADSVERGFVSELHRGRPNGALWRVSVSAPQANAWLNVKAPKWMASRGVAWPERVAELQMEFSEGRLALGVRLSADDGEQIVAATATPELRADGSLWLPIDGARAGRLDLPAGWTVGQLKNWMPVEVRDRESTQLVLGALAGAAPLFADASVELEDGRRVRLVGVVAEEGRLVLSCVTEESGEPRPTRH